MTVDGYGQSEPKGPFAWSRLTRSHKEVWVAAEYFDLFCGSHDGYAERGVAHQRWVFHLPGRFWLIRDVAEGSGVHNLELAWHLGPDLHSSEREGRFFTRSGPEYGLDIVASDQWRRELRPSWWSPVYGRREESWTLRCSAELELPAECATLLQPLSNRNQPRGSLSSLNESDTSELRAYVYEVGNEQHGFFFRQKSAPQKSAPWMHAGWASDAEFVYYRAVDRILHDLYFYDGSYVEAAGKRLVSAHNPVPYCQLVTRGETTQICSPYKNQVVLHQPLDHAVLGRDLALSGARDRTGR
jgi:hypothetical protein